MKKAPRRRGPVSKRLLVTLSVIFAIFAVGLLAVVLFNFRPYVNITGGQAGFMDYKHGIPVAATKSLDIADTSIKTYYQNGLGIAKLPYDRYANWKLRDKGLPERSDSIFAHYKFINLYSEVNPDVKINGIRMDRVKVYLQTKNVGYRLYYTYPVILNCMVASYCFWLLAQFVSAIQKGWSFTKQNRLRLEKVGFAVFFLQAAYFIVEFIPPLIDNVGVSYTSPIPGYWSHFDFLAYPVKPFSMTWLLISAVILVVANAFQDGEMLQEDKDLTI